MSECPHTEGSTRFGNLRRCDRCGEVISELAAPSGSVLLVSEDEYTANCPKCGGVLHAEKIHMDDPHCYFCGENLKVEINSPNNQAHGAAGGETQS